MRTLSSVILVAAAVGLAPPSSVAAPAPSCFPAHSKTIAATKTARVFETRRGTYGCLYKYNRARRLDPSSERLDTGETAYKPFRFAGPYVAYPRLVSQGCGIDVCNWTEVVVADLRPSRPLVLQKRYAASDETLHDFFADETVGGEAFVTDLVLTRRGLVGWIECEGFTPGPCSPASEAEKRQTSVFAAAPGHRSRTKVDEGAGIDKRSLTWAGGKFHWRDDGRPKSRAPA